MSIINEIIFHSPSISAEHKENIILRLSRKQASEGGERKFFNQYWQPFAWSAIIGFINDKRVPLPNKVDDDVFKYSVMNNQCPDVLKALIIIAIGKLNMSFEDEMINPLDVKDIVNIIDEYANGGFEIISRKLDNDPDYFYDHNTFIFDLLDRVQ